MNCCLLCLTPDYAAFCCVTATSHGVTPFHKGVNDTNGVFVGLHTVLLVEA